MDNLMFAPSLGGAGEGATQSLILPVIATGWCGSDGYGVAESALDLKLYDTPSSITFKWNATAQRNSPITYKSTYLRVYNVDSSGTASLITRTAIHELNTMHTLIADGSKITDNHIRVTCGVEVSANDAAFYVYSHLREIIFNF